MTPLATSATNILSFATLLGGILAVFLFLVLTTPLKKGAYGKTAADFFGRNAILFSFIVAISGVASSLFYSDIVGFLPCVLCWWQRIFLYPQVIIFAIALWKKDGLAPLYGIALSGLGFLVSLYHTYIQFGGEPLIPCTSTGVNCQTIYFLEYGYVTIPTMALTAFALILLFMLLARDNQN